MPFCRVGLPAPGVEVRFNNIKVSANVFVGARGKPGLTNDFRSMLESIFSPILNILGRGPEGVSDIRRASEFHAPLSS